MPTRTPEGHPEGTSLHTSSQGLEVTLPDVVGAAEVPERPSALFDLLRADHAEVRELLNALRTTPSGDAARDVLWETFSFRLAAHCRAEEDALYRLMSRMPQTLDIAEVSIEDHDQLQELVERMHRLPKTDTSDFRSLVARLQATLLRHHEEEERQVIPLVADTFDDSELERLAERYLRLRERHAVLLRHPETPEGPHDTWPPDALYELAQIRRVPGRGRMGRAELLGALRRSR